MYVAGEGVLVRMQGKLEECATERDGKDARKAGGVRERADKNRDGGMHKWGLAGQDFITCR